MAASGLAASGDRNRWTSLVTYAGKASLCAGGKVAGAIRVPYQRVNEIVNGRRGITPHTALRLAKFFGNSPDFWLNLQLRWDLYRAQKDEKNVLRTIRPHTAI